MKKNYFIALLQITLLSTLAGFSSCSPLEATYEASTDFNHHKYSGPSYENSGGSVDHDDFAINVGINFIWGASGVGHGSQGNINNPLQFQNDYSISSAPATVNSFDEAVANKKNILSHNTNVAAQLLWGINKGAGNNSKANINNPFKFQSNYSIGSAPATANSFYEAVANKKNIVSQNTKETKRNFKDNINIMTGLEFVMKNSKDGNTKIKTNYLQVPVIALYNYELDNGGKIFGGLGPYFAYGIGGKTSSGNFSISSFDKTGGFKRFDAGLTFTAGYRFEQGIRLRFGYDLGLTNIQRGDIDKAKNRGWSLCFAYPAHFINKKMSKKGK